MCVLFLPPLKFHFKKSYSELDLFQISQTKLEELKSLFTRPKKYVQNCCVLSIIVSLSQYRNTGQYLIERILSTFHSLLLLSGECMFGVNLTFLLNFYCRQYMTFHSQGGTSFPRLCGWMLQREGIKWALMTSL